MNKFAIAKKYNEYGKTNPIGFLKWLLTNLPDRLKGALKGFIEGLIHTLHGFDVAREASNRKIHMPWDKKENMVDPDYYDKEKEKAFDQGMANLFKALGMSEDLYFDPAMIEKAGVLEKFIKGTYEAAYEQNPCAEDSPEYREFVKNRKKSLDSIDVSKVGYGLTCTLGGQTREFAIMTKEELDHLLAGTKIEKPEFLATDKDFKVGEVTYYVIDTAHEQFKELMLDKTFGREMTEEELNPQKKEPEQEKAPENKEPTPEKEQEPVKEEKKTLEFKGIYTPKDPEIEAEKDLTQKTMRKVRAVYNSFKAGVDPADASKTYLKITAASNMIARSGKEGFTAIKIPFSGKDNQTSMYLHLCEAERLQGLPRVEKSDSGIRTMIVNLTETFPVFDFNGNPVIEADGTQKMISTESLCNSHFMVKGKATGEDLNVALTVASPTAVAEEPRESVVFDNGTLTFKGDESVPITHETIPEGAEITTLDFNHGHFLVAAGAINDMPGLTNIINAEYTNFEEGAVVGCPMELKDYLAEKEMPKEPEKVQEKEQEPVKEEKKEPTVFAKQQLLEASGITR